MHIWYALIIRDHRRRGAGRSAGSRRVHAAWMRGPHGAHVRTLHAASLRAASSGNDAETSLARAVAPLMCESASSTDTPSRIVKQALTRFVGVYDIVPDSLSIVLLIVCKRPARALPRTAPWRGDRGTHP